MFGFDELLFPCKFKKDKNIFNYLTISGPLKELEDFNTMVNEL